MYIRNILLSLVVVMSTSVAFAKASLQIPPEPTMNDLANSAHYQQYVNNMVEYLNQNDSGDVGVNKSNARQFRRIALAKSNGLITSDNCKNGKCTVYYGIKENGQPTLGILQIVNSQSLAGKEFVLSELQRVYQCILKQQRLMDIEPEIVSQQFGFYGPKETCSHENGYKDCQFTKDKIAMN